MITIDTYPFHETQSEDSTYLAYQLTIRTQLPKYHGFLFKKKKDHAAKA